MNHRHLLPDEIDLLLDGEVGFGVAPLRAHVDQCPDCRARLEDARGFIESLERLPDHAPSPLFAERVMAEVNVFVPWHVAARDAVREAVVPRIPRSQPMRVLAGGVVTAVAAVLAIVTVGIAARFDLVMFFLSGIAFDRARELALAVAGGTLTSLFGEAAAAAILASGSTGVLLALVALLLTATLAVFGMRRLVVARARSR